MAQEETEKKKSTPNKGVGRSYAGKGKNKKKKVSSPAAKQHKGICLPRATGRGRSPSEDENIVGGVFY